MRCAKCSKSSSTASAPHVDDDFFSLGLDSIVAISIVSTARRRGHRVESTNDVDEHRRFATLAAAIDAAAGFRHAAVENAEYGEVLPLPMVSWLCEFGNYRRFTHNFLLRLPPGIDRACDRDGAAAAVDGHDTLRSMSGRHRRWAAPGHPRAGVPSAPLTC